MPYQHRGQISDLAVEEVEANRQGHSPDAQATAAFAFANQNATS
jgi:hypothetical protein